MRKVRGRRKVRRPLFSRWIERLGLMPAWPRGIAIADVTQRPVISAKAMSPLGVERPHSLPPCLNGPPAQCPLLALSGHSGASDQCPLLGVKRTSQLDRVMSVFDAERKSHLVARRTKSVIALHAPDFMYRHPAFDRYRESYPRRSELHQNCYSRAGDEQSAAPAGV